MFCKSYLIVNIGLVFIRAVVRAYSNFEPCCPAQSVFIFIVFYMSVFYEQINDDDDDDNLSCIVIHWQSKHRDPNHKSWLCLMYRRIHIKLKNRQTLAWSLRLDDCCCRLLSSSFSYNLHDSHKKVTVNTHVFTTTCICDTMTIDFYVRQLC